jgi:uncharacterized protein (UPF0332 family)
MPSSPLLEKAERFIDSAMLLAEDGDYDSAASRLYYAMFFVAEALLAERGYIFSSHRAVISAFGQHFAKTGELDPGFHKALMAAFNQRQLGDYAMDSGLGRDDVDQLLSDAKEFLDAGRSWLDMRV